MSKQVPMGGLVLSGGGARGAYQVGAVRAVIEIATDMGIKQPFKVFTGSSVGSINVAFLAAHAGNLKGAVRRLSQMWGALHTHDIYETNLSAVAKNAFGLIVDLSFGGLMSRKTTTALLDTTPLRRLITRVLTVDRIEDNIRKGTLQGVAVKALDYGTGMSTTFFQGNPSILPWLRSQRLAERTRLSVDHIMASAAIPVLFPSVKVGERFYGDGSIRNYTPLSPAIKMGAERLMVISVKQPLGSSGRVVSGEPSLARVMSILLNSLLLDNIDLDHERLTRINNTIQLLKSESDTALKPVNVCLLHPDVDLGRVAMEYISKMPKTIRFLLQGWGKGKDASDVVSNLLFEPTYIQRVMDLGYEDTMKKRDLVESFFSEPAV